VDCSLSNRCVGGNTGDGKTLLHCGQAEMEKLNLDNVRREF